MENKILRGEKIICQIIWQLYVWFVKNAPLYSGRIHAIPKNHTNFLDYNPKNHTDILDYEKKSVSLQQIYTDMELIHRQLKMALCVVKSCKIVLIGR